MNIAFQQAIEHHLTPSIHRERDIGISQTWFFNMDNLKIGKIPPPNIFFLSFVFYQEWGDAKGDPPQKSLSDLRTYPQHNRREISRKKGFNTVMGSNWILYCGAGSSNLNSKSPALST